MTQPTARSHRFIALAACGIALAVSGATGGCATTVAVAVVGAGTYAFLQGDIERRIDADVMTVWSSVRSVSSELGLIVTKDELDGLEGSLVAERADGQIVRIEARGTGSVTTEIKIRVGLGDKSKSRAIMRKVELEMPAGTPPSSPVPSRIG